MRDLSATPFTSERERETVGGCAIDSVRTKCVQAKLAHFYIIIILDYIYDSVMGFGWWESGLKLERFGLLPGELIAAEVTVGGSLLVYRLL